MNFQPKSRTNSLVVRDANHLLDAIDLSSDTAEDGEERTLRAEAKSHRKVLICFHAVSLLVFLTFGTDCRSRNHYQVSPSH